MSRILVVDDAAFVRMQYKKSLIDNGYEVEEASNGVDALKKYKEPGDFWDKVYGQISSDLQKMETVEGLAKEVVKYAGMGSLEETERCLNEIDVASNSVESFHPFSEFYQQQIAKVPSFDTYKVAAINFTKEKQLASK